MADSIDEEVSEQEFTLQLNSILKDISLEKKLLLEKELMIVNVISDVVMYKSLNFKMKYYWCEKEQTYKYQHFVKDKAGFRR